MPALMGSRLSLLVRDLKGFKKKKKSKKVERLEIQRSGAKVSGKVYDNESIKCEDLYITHLCNPGNIYHGKGVK